jgi:hypothetical protein
MDHVFSVEKGFKVPDNTLVYPFLNSKDSMSQLPWDLSDGVSLAVGEIAPASRSHIHIHPIVTLITWIISGELHLRMKDPVSLSPYTLQLHPEQAAVSRPQTFLQHINNSSQPCRVLYIVSPAYVFVLDDQGQVVYDDAIVTLRGWDELAQQGWMIPEITDLSQLHQDRENALAILQARKARQNAT